MKKCNHDKSFSMMALLSNPPQHLWICRKCGEEGRDQGQFERNDYAEIKEKFTNQQGRK